MNNRFNTSKLATADTLQVFKTGSSWSAHLYWSDGKCWSYWQHGFSTKTELLKNAVSAFECAGSDPVIERGMDEGRK